MDDLLNHAQRLASQTSTPIAQPIEGRIAYVVSHGQSYASNGYAIRTQGIAKALNDHGLEALCFVRPGRPWELQQAPMQIEPETTLEGVRYIHTRWLKGEVPQGDAAHMAASVKRLVTLFRIYRPSAVLAASNWICGLPAWVAAKQLGLPFYSEVRGFWELSREAREPGYCQQPAFKQEAERDTFVTQQAQGVFTLNAPMKAELVNRGVEKSRIGIVPNAVSVLPEIKPAPTSLKNKLGIADNEKVVGYIGSFSPYEGLDVLLEACTELVQSGEKLKLLLVGDSQPVTQASQRLTNLAEAPWLIQVGRVPHEHVADYYALLDAVVIPRKPLAVCQLVPPMKAAEALAYGKRLVVSDVAPLAEYAEKFDGVVSFEAGSATSLATALQRSLKQPAPPQSTELLFAAHTKPMVRALKGEGGAWGQKAVGETTPLKRYTDQPTLSLVKAAKGGTPAPKKEDIVIAANKHFEIKQQVVSGEEYSLSVTCIANRANPKGAVADVTFLDESGNTLPKPYPGMAKSKAFGAYFYVETQEREDSKPKVYTFTAPEKAANVAIKLVAFGVKPDMTLAGDYRLISTKDRIKESAEGSKYIESFEEILLEAEAIPDSNGSEYFTKHDFRVGVIGDVYMYNFYKDVFTTVHYLSPSNYSEVLAQGLDIVIYTTCWKGINNEEWRGVKFREKPKEALDAILGYAKENNVKTVFQTIEDPSNFEYFLPVAEKFDYVLTTDTDCIERYKEELGHNRVFFGEYGVNPQFNNPIGSRRNTRNAAFFAGSYPKRYKERCDDMETIFDSIIDSGGELLIADRNFGADSEDLVYPARFQSSVLPPVQHAVLQKLHKLFRYNLNFNSIKQSPTMCAMRVYELQAQGNGFISNYANSVFNNFPGIRIVPFKQDMSFDFGRDETWEEYHANVGNIREVLNSKASYQVVSTLLENIGLSSKAKNDTTIAVFCQHKTPTVIQSFESQSYPDKVLFEESELEDWAGIKEKYQVGYFCWFSGENHYEKHYLNDLLNGFKYTDCRYITKNAYFDSSGRYMDGAQHEYTSRCSGKGLSLFSAKYLAPAELGSYEIGMGFKLDNGYSIDPFEVNFVTYMQRCLPHTDSYQLSVIVPVYNNGRFLVSKCIPSLQRNHLWPEMEILLVDDGSTDSETLATLEYLDAIYPNVRVRFNHDGGSGSASRPRNQGIDMAAAPLVTFLDPDNEIAPGAYDLLIELYREANQNSPEPVEFVSGFHVKVGEDVKTIGKHTPKRLSVIKDFKKGYFDRGRFPVVATQSAVLAKELLDKYAIRFVERSAGQDTLFGWELIAKAKCGAFNGDAYIIYYADRSDSITNEVNKSYFEKKLILEREQKKFLEENGFLESFVDNRFDQFMKDWYLRKFDYVANESQVECMEILRDICSIYQKDLNDYL
ncbi:glycosyltransferase [Halomonas sp. FME65]|uniref:glycosyltransferase n=1 Tax=Halomonas sp. FME65 TaxID=2742614 RepID=UPI0018668453|nr:glycosyltransferase [Halomonas sp. FME65]